MGYQYEIKHIDQVIKPYLGKNVKIVKSNVQRLTQPGENYGSLMLSVDITVVDDEDHEETIHVVAKMCPPNSWLQKMFNTPVTFKKEESVYSEISVALKAFEKKYGLSKMTYYFPKYYGSRLSLNPNKSEVDDDAVLLIENLKPRGYYTGDRFEGFDLETSKVIVKALAKFHSTALALKLKEPDAFDRYVVSNTKKMKGFSDITEEQRQQGEDIIMNIVRKYEEFIPYTDLIKKYYRQGDETFREGPDAREPFATIGHSDFWVNNMLINKEEGETGVKFVDFQIVDYGSPARDLIFFIYISVQNEVASKHFGELLQLYYDTFIQTLELFKCNTQPFSYTAFANELQLEVKVSQLYHCVYMALPIFALKGAVKPIEELTADDLYNPKLSDKFELKIVHIISSFIKNGWL